MGKSLDPIKGIERFLKHVGLPPSLSQSHKGNWKIDEVYDAYSKIRQSHKGNWKIDTIARALRKHITDPIKGIERVYIVR